MRIGLDEALDLTRTGDVWLFRGHTAADRAIQLTTNSPVNHVGMSVVLDDLPPLMWHAELGRSLPDLWSGDRHRGAQLHDLRAAVTVWASRYGQRAWLRQLEPPPGRAMEDALLRTVARLDGTPFPPAARIATGWLRGRLPPVRRGERDAALETAYCAEIVAVTYQAMGLLPAGASRTGMTPAGSGAGMISACPQEPGSAGKSPYRSPRRSPPQLVTDIRRSYNPPIMLRTPSVSASGVRGVSAGGIRPPYLQKADGGRAHGDVRVVDSPAGQGVAGSPATSAGLTGPAGVNPAALAEGVSTCSR